jgi:hypothetical protein
VYLNRTSSFIIYIIVIIKKRCPPLTPSTAEFRTLIIDFVRMWSWRNWPSGVQVCLVCWNVMTIGLVSLSLSVEQVNLVDACSRNVQAHCTGGRLRLGDGVHSLRIEVITVCGVVRRRGPSVRVLPRCARIACTSSSFHQRMR